MYRSQTFKCFMKAHSGHPVVREFEHKRGKPTEASVAKIPGKDEEIKN